MNPVIIDVREPAEFEKEHVEGAINLPPFELLRRSPKLDAIEKDHPIIVYCLSGSRSGVAIQILSNMGYTNLTNGINMHHVNRSR